MGGDLPEAYKRLIDPLVGLSAAAVAAPGLHLGTCVLLLAQRDPILTAKALATLDLLSGGRLSVGIGYGWNVEEMADHGVTFATRRERAREHVLAMRRLWSEEVAAFTGAFVRLEPSWSWPKPVQRGGPPVLIGGAAGSKLFRHIAEYGDGWLPTHGPKLDVSICQLQKSFEDVGRDPSTLLVATAGSSYAHPDLDFLERAGVTEHIWSLRPGTAEEVLPQIDRVAAFIAERAR